MFGPLNDLSFLTKGRYAAHTLSPSKQMAKGSHVPSETVKEKKLQNYISSTRASTWAQVHPFAQYLAIKTVH